MMSARGDYKWPSQLHDATARDAQHGTMLDEIDVLRSKKKADDMVFAAINSLVLELTAHADRMREELAKVCPFLALTHYSLRDEVAAVVEAYDSFIMEA